MGRGAFVLLVTGVGRHAQLLHVHRAERIDRPRLSDGEFGMECRVHDQMDAEDCLGGHQGRRAQAECRGRFYRPFGPDPQDVDLDRVVPELVQEQHRRRARDGHLCWQRVVVQAASPGPPGRRL